MSSLAVASHCESDATAANWEMMVSPFQDEVTPKTYEALMKDVTENISNSQMSSVLMDIGISTRAQDKPGKPICRMVFVVFNCPCSF